MALDSRTELYLFRVLFLELLGVSILSCQYPFLVGCFSFHTLELKSNPELK